MIQNLLRWFERANTISALNRLNDAELRDVGLRRDQITGYVDRIVEERSS